MSLIVLIITFFLTVAVLLVMRPLAKRLGLLDLPGGRKVHVNPTPMIGGLGIYLGLLCVAMLLPVLLQDYLMLLALSGFVLFVGLLDDLYGMRVSLRLMLHMGAAWVMAFSAGVQLQSFGDIVFTGPIMLGMLAIPLTVFATVGVINAINMSDGLDGLSGGLSVIALIFLSITATVSGQGAILSFSQILIVCLLAFLTLNFRTMWHKSALIYLGDAGSTLLGFIIAWLLIAATQGNEAFIAPVYALWFLAIPLFDTVGLMIRRPLAGKSPFSAGRDHIHHRLLNAGFSSMQTTLILHMAAVVMGCIGLVGHFAGAPEGLMFLLFVSAFGVYMLASRRSLRLEANKTTPSEQS
jgi:UDP-GlcNAc:undecaprenyl-phosphate GlcNAc-1-phosphate transferase